MGPHMIKRTAIHFKARYIPNMVCTVYPKKYAHGFCFAVLCCGYTLSDFPISIRLTSLALWQSNDCPSANKATLMNMDKYFMWIHYERLHNHNKAKHNKTVCIFLGIYCTLSCFVSHIYRVVVRYGRVYPHFLRLGARKTVCFRFTAHSYSLVPVPTYRWTKQEKDRECLSNCKNVKRAP